MAHQMPDDDWAAIEQVLQAYPGGVSARQILGEGPARILLAMLERNPRIVQETLT